jgi:uncharacterized membrane protein
MMMMIMIMMLMMMTFTGILVIILSVMMSVYFSHNSDQSLPTTTTRPALRGHYILLGPAMQAGELVIWGPGSELRYHQTWKKLGNPRRTWAFQWCKIMVKSW